MSRCVLFLVVERKGNTAHALVILTEISDMPNILVTEDSNRMLTHVFSFTACTYTYTSPRRLTVALRLQQGRRWSRGNCLLQQLQTVLQRQGAVRNLEALRNADLQRTVVLPGQLLSAQRSRVTFVDARGCRKASTILF